MKLGKLVELLETVGLSPTELRDTGALAAPPRWEVDVIAATGLHGSDGGSPILSTTLITSSSRNSSTTPPRPLAVYNNRPCTLAAEWPFDIAARTSGLARSASSA